MRGCEMHNGNRWTTEQFQELIGMWLRGVEVATIAAHFHVTINGLNKAVLRLRRNGVPLPLRKRGHKAGRCYAPWTQEEVETVVRMKDSGADCAAIAAELDRSFYGVSAMIGKLRNEGVPIVKTGAGCRRLWDAERLRGAIAGRGLKAIGRAAESAL